MCSKVPTYVWSGLFIFFIDEDTRFCMKYHSRCVDDWKLILVTCNNKQQTLNKESAEALDIWKNISQGFIHRCFVIILHVCKCKLMRYVLLDTGRLVDTTDVNLRYYMSTCITYTIMDTSTLIT